jgi:hypothetical protein
MPGLAPQVMAWQRRMANLPGPVGASGEASSGEPVLVELFIDGVWVDITSYVMVRDDSGRITITRGIRDEGNQTEQANGQMPLKNQDGRFSRRNPTGPYYRLIGRNQPIRVSVPDGMGGKSYRLPGEVPDWPKSWDPTGTDVWVDITASGILRRLAQGPAPERSVIYNAVTDPVSPSLVAYWSCEDASDATTIASALVNGSPMTFNGSPALASYTGFGASDPLPDLSAGYLAGGVVRYTDPAAHQTRFLAFIPQAGLSDGKVLCAIDQLDYSAGSPQFWELYYSAASHSLTLRTCASDGTNLGADLVHTVDVRNRLMYVSVEQQENGTGVDRALRVMDITNAQVYSVTDSATLTQLTRVTRVQFGPASRSAVGPAGTQYLPGVAVGHCTVETAITAMTALGVRLNPLGEMAGRRIQRLCGEEGIPFQWIGDLDDTTEMGQQGKQNPLSLMQEAAAADGGMLYETPDILGLGYRTRASLYNQDPALTLDYAGFNLSEVPTPTDDDRYLQNKVTVTVNGVSQTYEETEGALSTAPPPAGVGVYGPSGDVPLNLADALPDTLRDQAAWRVHLGTVDEDRFPSISVNLAHATFANNPALKRAVLALRQGDRILIQNPPLWLGADTIDQLILGFEESITRFEHRLTFACAPASPYTVGVLDDPDARLDTDGSSLLDAIGTGDMNITVATEAGYAVWIDSATYPEDFPFDVRAGGEVWTVTAINPYLSDAFGRTVSNGWGTSDTGQTWSTGGGTAADYAVASGVGSHTLATVDLSRRCFVTAAFTDFDYYVDVTASATATGGSLYGGPTGRYIDSDNLYQARLEFTTGNALILTIRKRVASVETQLAAYSMPDTYTPGTFFRIRFQAQGAVLRAKAWLASDVEQPVWLVTVADGSFSTSALMGVRSIASAANTNVNPVVSYDNVRVVNPQTFTVTRSVNGVVKSHPAGEDVRLATPTILAL